ncbi:MAG: glycerate dehydrogenase [Gammaproteobacteria bacterium SG8_11]|nr:MAG: glycerate dehydrogenase [Gammaproteobacteria bacterium SG8_11]
MDINSGVFLDVNSVDRGDLDLATLKATLPSWQFFEKTPAQQISQRIAQAQIVISNKASLTKQSLQSSENLKLICVAATGTNNVDLQAAARQGIAVCNVRDYATASVVQHVFTLILNLSTQFLSYQRAVKQGRWQASDQFCLLDYPIQELAGKILGVIGYGVLGHAVAAAAQAFGMQVLIADHKGVKPRSGRIAFEEVLTQADVITLHCPLTAETTGLIGYEELQAMKSSAFLINAARGGIVDEHAVVRALQQKQIAGAGFDVLTEEPPVHGNVLLDAGLPNLIVTPHIAWASRESRQRLVIEIVKNIEAFKSGHPRNIVAG